MCNLLIKPCEIMCILWLHNFFWLWVPTNLRCSLPLKGGSWHPSLIQHNLVISSRISSTQGHEVQSLQPSTWTAASLIESSVWVAASTHSRLAWLDSQFLPAAECSPHLVSTTILSTTSKHCLIRSYNYLETSSCWIGLQSTAIWREQQ